VVFSDDPEVPVGSWLEFPKRWVELMSMSSWSPKVTGQLSSRDTPNTQTG